MTDELLEITHPELHLLAMERTGWRRWVFGRWVYKSEPFRRDIQRKCRNLSVLLHPWERICDPEDPLNDKSD